jgi:alcohol dehydrogenase (cytochrome c)
LPNVSPTREGTLLYPSVRGGTNWWSPSFDAKSGTFFVPAMEGPSVFFRSEGDPVRNDHGGLLLGSYSLPASGRDITPAVRALDAATGALRWSHDLPTTRSESGMGGLLSTDGGIVFGGDQGRFFALDAQTGHELWFNHTEGQIIAAPITYLSRGRQLITIAQGRAILTFALDAR